MCAETVALSTGVGRALDEGDGLGIGAGVVVVRGSALGAAFGRANGSALAGIADVTGAALFWGTSTHGVEPSAGRPACADVRDGGIACTWMGAESLTPELGGTVSAAVVATIAPTAATPDAIHIGRFNQARRPPAPAGGSPNGGGHVAATGGSDPAGGRAASSDA